MKRGLSILLLCLLFAGTVVLGHEGMVHIMGTVTQITADSVVVKTTKGTVATVAVNADTQFKKDDAAAQFADLKVGDRVAIHAKENNKKLVAVEVMLGQSSAAKKK